MRKYLINFFLWWYLVNAKDIYKSLVSNWALTLDSLNIVPMLRNLFVPLFQDYSWEGKIVAIPFRIFWVFFGLLFQLFYSIILAIVFIGYLLVPISPIGLIVINFFI